jgi:hypothetical protein
MSSARFGIIRLLPDGIPQWIGAAKGLAEAKARVMSLASREPGEFFIYSEKRGNIVEKFVCVKAEEDHDHDQRAVGKCGPSLQPSEFLN